MVSASIAPPASMSPPPLPPRAPHLADFIADPVGRYFVAGATLCTVITPSAGVVALTGRPGPDEARAALAAFDALDSPAMRGPVNILLDARRLSIDLGGLDALVAWVRTRHAWLASRIGVQVGLVRYGPAALTLCGVLPFLGPPYPFVVTESPDEAMRRVGLPHDTLAIVDALVDRDIAEPSTITRLRLLLDERQPALPVDVAARALGLSTRTLQRALTQAGTSYGAEVRRARYEVARRLLLETDDKVAEVARRVGISESALTELTRTIAGCTPAALRRRA